MIATNKSKKLTALVAVLLSFFLLTTLCAVPVFADETDTTDETGDHATESLEDELESETENESGDESGDESAGETTAGKGDETKADEGEETESAADRTKRVRGLVNLGVGAVILLILAILAIKFRKKIPASWKALKSECGKISWCSKDKLKKNTLVVVIIILAIAVSIAVLDFVFTFLLRDFLSDRF